MARLRTAFMRRRRVICFLYLYRYVSSARDRTHLLFIFNPFNSFAVTRLRSCGVLLCLANEKCLFFEIPGNFKGVILNSKSHREPRRSAQLILFLRLIDAYNFLKLLFCLVVKNETKKKRLHSCRYTNKCIMHSNMSIQLLYVSYSREIYNLRGARSEWEWRREKKVKTIV